MNEQIESLDSHENTSEITTIAKGAGIVFTGTLIGTGLRYIFQIIAARNLGTELFGLFFLGFAAFRIAEKISELGLPRGIIRYVAVYQGLKDNKRTKGVIVLSVRSAIIAGVTVGTIIYLLSEALSIHLFHKPELAPVLKFFAVIIPFSTVTTMLVFSIQGFKVMKYNIFVRELFEPLLRVVLVGIVFILLSWKLYGALVAYLIPTILGAILAFYYLKKIFPQISKKEVSPIYETKKLFSFSLPLLFIYFAGFLLIWIDILMVGYFRTSQDVGVYSAAQRTTLLGVIILTSFNSIFAPIISDLYSRGELRKLQDLFKTVTKWIFTFSFPVYLTMIFFAEPILNIFSSEFNAGAICLIILSIGFLVHSSAGPVGLMLTMTGRIKLQLINAISSLFLNIILNLILIPKYGISGAAIATAISIVLTKIITIIEVFYILRIHPYRIDFLKPLIAGSLSILVIFSIMKNIFQEYNVFILFVFILLLFSIYSIILILLGVREEDKIVFRKIKKGLISANIKNG